MYTASVFYAVLLILNLSNVWRIPAKKRHILSGVVALLMVASAVNSELFINATAVAALALPLILGIGREWWKAAIAGLTAGAIGWKLCDLFPLFFDLSLLGAIPAVLLACLLCKGRGARCLAVCISPIIARAILSLYDYSLFGYAPFEISNAVTNGTQAIGLSCVLLYSILEGKLLGLLNRKQAVVIDKQGGY
ncbi:MAG: hypothetical protein Q4C01_05725 [Clostridia bacterium]|nr:hypothetical protein [Clostridia bacterium]